MGNVTIYSPYEKIYDYWGESSIESVPLKLRDYLMLFPSEKCPNPILTNENPRVRLLKYLYYDDAHPLDNPIPTIEQRKEIIFDPFNPTAPVTDKGYRIFSQAMTEQIEYEGKTILRIIMGRILPITAYSVSFAVDFYMLTNTTNESNTKDLALNRLFSMTMCLLEALNGVNIDGVGAFSFNRGLHSDCESSWITDERHSVGRIVTLAFESVGGGKHYNDFQ